MTTTATHQFAPPPAGHIDGATACDTCGFGPLASRHLTRSDLPAALGQDSLTVARTVAGAWLDGLAEVGGNAEFGRAALRAVLAALDGETDPTRLGFSGIRGHLGTSPATGARQHALPLPA